MQLKGRQHCERRIVLLCQLLSLYRDISHGLYREETRLLFTVARLFRTAGENAAVKFPSLEIYALPPRTARPTFLRKKM